MERPNLHQYAYNGDEDFKEFREQDDAGFHAYFLKIFDFFDAIKEGEEIDVLKIVSPESYKKFTKVAGYYMQCDLVQKGAFGGILQYRDEKETLIFRNYNSYKNRTKCT